MPHSRVSASTGGLPIYQFDAQLVLPWIALHGRMTARRAAEAAQTELTDAKEQAKDGEAKQSEPLLTEREPARLNIDLMREPGLVGNLERLRAQELATSASLLRAKQQPTPNVVVIAGLSDRHIKESRAIATLENAVLQYRIRMGELGPREELQSAFERVLVSVRNAVLGLPVAVIPRIMPYLKKQDDAHTVRRIIDEAARSALREASRHHS